MNRMELNIFSLAWMTLTFIQVHMDARKQNCTSHFPQFSTDF